MTTCMYCGSEISDSAKFCTNCGAALPVEAPIPQSTYDAPAQQPYEQPAQQPYEQPAQQQPYQQPGQQQPYQQAPVAEDSGSIGWAILGFIIPLVGIILFFVWRTTKPKSANMAITGAAVCIVLALLMRVVGAA